MLTRKGRELELSPVNDSQVWRPVNRAHLLISRRIQTGESRAVIQGFQDTLFAATGEHWSPSYVIPNLPVAATERIDTAWLSRCSEKWMGQINVEDMIFKAKKFYDYPSWQKIIIVLNNPISREEDSLINLFGTAEIGGRIGVVTVNKFRKFIPYGRLRLDMIRRLARHESGHMFGLDHCKNICTMKFSPNVNASKDVTQKQEERKIIFCPDCMLKLSQQSMATHQTPTSALPSKPQ